MYIRMSKHLWAKYDPENKKDYKKACKKSSNLSKEQKEKKQQQYGRELQKSLRRWKIKASFV